MGFGDLRYSTVDAGPAVFITFLWTATPGRFFSGTEALHASCPGLLLGELGDLAVDAHPTGRRLRFTRLPRCLFGTEALTAASLALNLGSSEDFAMSAAPTRLSALSTMPACFFLGAVTLSAAFYPGLRLGDLNDFAVNAAPPISFFATLKRFFSGRVRLCTASLALFNGCLTDLSVDAAPNGVMVDYRTIPSRFLFGAVALSIIPPALLRGGLADLSVDAAPTFRQLTMLTSFLFGSVPLTALLLAIRLALLDDTHAGGCVNAAPADIDTMAARFLFGSVTLKPSFSGFRLWNPNDFSVNADPARFRALPQRFFSGRVAFSAAHARVVHRRELHDLSVNAIPTGLLLAVSQRFFARPITPAASSLALRFRQMEELTLDAAPAPLLTMLGSFLRRRVTSQTVRLSVRVGGLHDLPIDADPARLLTILRRFRRRGITLQTARFRVRLRHLHRFTVDADPAPLLTILDRFLR